jgi:hypothetical protein
MFIDFIRGGPSEAGIAKVATPGDMRASTPTETVKTPELVF